MGNLQIDASGKRFGRLLVLARIGNSKSGGAQWLCICDCGYLTYATGSNLKSGNTRSCGCLFRETSAATLTTHGLSKIPGYSSWRCLVRRCTDPRSVSFPYYGGRGIKVCPEWRDSPGQFLQDMGPRPSAEHSVERDDNDGDYEPENCRWATKTEQARNGRGARLITLDGRTACIAEWAEILGVNRRTLRTRLSRGWSEEKTLTTPVNKKLGRRKRK